MPPMGSGKILISMLLGQMGFSATLRPFSLPQFASSPASRFDAWEKSHGSRLNGGRATINRTRILGRKVNRMMTASAFPTHPIAAFRSIQKRAKRFVVSSYIRSVFLKVTTDVGPNISGSFNANNGLEQNWSDYFYASGAFSCSGETSPKRLGNASNAGVGGRIRFSADDSNSVFGSASTVQPSAFRSLLCIKS